MVRSSDAMQEAVKNFQSMNRLKPTGKINEETKKLMKRSRCGNRDPVSRIKSRSYGELLPYELHGSKWTNYKLTYRFKNFSQKMTKEGIIKIVKEAFGMWSQVTPLRFIESNDKKKRAHIDIQFSTRIHCCHEAPPDSAKFEGPGGVMAHTTYPEDGGEIHVDDDENWRLEYDPKDTNTMSFKYVMVHEIGHVLGLEHSHFVEGSIMAPYYYNTDVPPNFKLHETDIIAIQKLYGNQSIKLP
ncbi:matrix metalloproteinase-15-like [Oppia nitens]|uniref:matrix metalloproteinase-15-like n=1 Tax=Oppia nitens TaxID=1686743 RepID=UPI0023DA890F|nr:matrix metalloproteinase-15-like [Oppia nitens]